MNVKIAILCMAHTIDDNFKLLMKQLSSDFDIFVHFDKKNEQRFTNEISMYKGSNVKFIDDNISVYWGGVSQIICEYKLFYNAYHSNNNYSHYILISGADFPVKSNRDIKKFFADNFETNFIETSALPSTAWNWNGGLDRVNKYWLTEFKNRFYTKLFGRILHFLQTVVGVERKTFFKNYYVGSNWVNLTHEAVGYLVNFADEVKLKEIFSYTRATDEIWKQTILNLMPNNNIVNNNLRYIDWTSGPPYPKTLDMSDIDKIILSNALFARKMASKDISLQKLLIDLSEKYEK